MGLLLEAKKPLERTPHFFEPGVGECVNALGQLEQIIGFEPIPVVWKTTVLTANTISAYKRLSFQTARVSVLIDAKSATLTKKRWCH